VSSSFRHAFHAQQGIECEDCHGAGSLHVAGGGDVTKIVSYKQRSARDANGACLSCHAQDDRIRNWMTGPHASNNVRCTECHQIHAYGAKTGDRMEAAVNLMTPGRVTAVEDVVPEAKVMMQPDWQEMTLA
jgi:formate-dependent nitrite reductase cytochrome c552 subunit